MTGRQALLGSHAIGEAKPRRKRLPEGRRIQGKTRLTVDRCFESGCPGRLAVPDLDRPVTVKNEAVLGELLARAFLLSVLKISGRPKRAIASCSTSTQKSLVSVLLMRQATTLRL